AWLRAQEVHIVAIEGVGGYAHPLESALSHAQIPFVSLPPYQVARYRQAAIGQHKSDRNDATAVARLAHTLHAHRSLDPYRRDSVADDALRSLVRMYEQKQKELTREVNRLWRIIHTVCGDLFLALRSGGPLFASDSGLTCRWVLRLLANHPNPFAWNQISPHTLAASLGDHRPIVVDKLSSLCDLIPRDRSCSPTEQLQLRLTAQTALSLKDAAETLYRQIARDAAAHRPAARLMASRGIGPIIAASIVTEIIDIRRFPSNNHLASYSGLARREYKTGRSPAERAPVMFNRRLKRAFFLAARSLTVFNPDSDLAAYYRSLRERGMAVTEAHKRVARAIVRRVYRTLKALSVDQMQDARHVGNPVPEPACPSDRKQPHASRGDCVYHTAANADGEHAQLLCQHAAHT
ncbi:MAG: IS110 family transposase, partial [Spirochaetales bacterium]|nr:IS110 family transposase [Spirochaetales bacterium]